MKERNTDWHDDRMHSVEFTEPTLEGYAHKDVTIHVETGATKKPSVFFNITRKTIDNKHEAVVVYFTPEEVTQLFTAMLNALEAHPRFLGEK